MTTDPKNPHSSGDDDDSWEQLAEDLFGTEPGKEHTASSRVESPATPADASESSMPAPAGSFEFDERSTPPEHAPPGSSPSAFAAPETAEEDHTWQHFEEGGRESQSPT